MAYNPNLSYFMSRLQGVSQNYFRLESQNSAVASANKIIRFALPSNCLLNTKSLAFMFNATVAGTNSAGRLPADISCLIDRVELSSGGIQISQGYNGFGVFKKAKDALCGEIPDQLNHPEIVRATSYVDGSAIATTANEVYSDANGQTQFCIKNWEGFLGSVAPSIIDTSLLSDCVLTLYLAGDEVLTSSSTDVDTIANFVLPQNPLKNATWSMSNFHLVVETIGMADSVLDEMVARRISDVGYIEMPFKTYYTFSDTHNGNTRFSLSTQSLDRVWVIWRDNAYETQGPPKVVAGHKTVLGETGEYDEGVLGTDSEKYIGKFFNYVERPDGGAKPLYQLNFNGSFVPQFKATAEQMLEITKNSLPTLDEKKRNKPVMSLDQYKKNHFVQCVRLNLPESEEINQLSGIDTRGIALNAYLSTSGLTAGAGVMIVCEATSTARIGEGRAMEIIS
jgi:hypothetical protein